MTKKLVWLRHETKKQEHRVALDPKACLELQKLGHEVIIERSDQRIFVDQEYEKLGLKMVPPNSWKQAPEHAIILGLKELEEDNFPLIHKHIHFAHAYKNQKGSKKFLNRFTNGKGKLYDLEFLIDKNGNRVCAFGHWAGFTGAALGIDIWAHRALNKSFNSTAPLNPYENVDQLILSLKNKLEVLENKPKVLVIGAFGRCGKGATKLLKKLDINCELWGSKDTSKFNGTIAPIMDFDILINCVYLKGALAPFIDSELVRQGGRLKVISDVSCDPTGPYNPIRVYNQCTTMTEPEIRLKDNKHISLTAIDHLPSLLPRESSEDFCSQLLPHLINFLDDNETQGPFTRSLDTFHKSYTNSLV